MKTLLIDGDILAYKNAASSEFSMNIYEDVYTLYASVGEAMSKVVDEINDLKTASTIDNVVVAFSDRKVNFRKGINPQYKANRSGTRKPLIYYELRDKICATYSSVVYPRLEADDAMGILGSMPKSEYVLVSIDKDMRTIPCSLFVDGTFVDISLAEANRNFLKQTLTGDTTDNYKGCVGIGEVKAAKHLAEFNMVDDFDKAWERVVELFKAAGQTEEDAIREARMARILRHGEYDVKSGEIKLWKM